MSVEESLDVDIQLLGKKSADQNIVDPQELAARRRIKWSCPCVKIGRDTARGCWISEFVRIGRDRSGGYWIFEELR